jgi:hypothetical protein
MKKITAVEYLMMKMQIIHAHGKKIDGGFRANGDFFFDVKTGEEYYEKNFKD